MDLAAVHRNARRRVDSEPDLSPLDLQHGHLDVIANHQRFADSPRQNEHVFLLRASGESDCRTRWEVILRRVGMTPGNLRCAWRIHALSLYTLGAEGAAPVARGAAGTRGVAARSPVGTRLTGRRRCTGARPERCGAQCRARAHREWADVRPAYVDARPRGRHSVADAMRREGLRWEGRHHRAEADCRAVLALMRRMAEEQR